MAELANLAPQVAIVALFLGFLYRVGVKFSEALDKNTKAMGEVATATKKAAREAKDRNGYLADLVMQTRNIDVQKVETQVVKEQRQ